VRSVIWREFDGRLIAILPPLYCYVLAVNLP
jgi:hypothetical protein